MEQLVPTRRRVLASVRGHSCALKSLLSVFGILAGLGNELPYINFVPGVGLFELLVGVALLCGAKGRLSHLFYILLVMSVISGASLCVSVLFGNRQEIFANNLLYVLRFCVLALVVFYFSGSRQALSFSDLANGFVVGVTLQGIVFWGSWFDSPRYFLGLPTLAFSDFINANTAGYYISLGFLLSILMPLTLKRLVVALFLFMSCLLTLSKGAWVVCCLGSFLFLFKSKGSLFLSTGIFAILLLRFGDTLVELLSTRVGASGGSNEHRRLMVEQTVEAISDKPFFGVGPGGWAQANADYGLGGVSDSHNALLNLSIESGAFQGALFLIVAATYVVLAIRAKLFIALALAMHFVLYSFLIGLVYSDRAHWMFMGALLGFVLLRNKNGTANNVSSLS